jgi:signal transduction histidine kinase
MVKIRRGAGWRSWLVGGFAVVIVVMACLWGYSLFTPIDQAEQEQEYDNLESVANAGATLIENSSLDAQEVVDSLDADGRLRVTLVSSDGSVLADSQADATTMGNHSDRPEIEQALAGEVGRDRRYSDTEQAEYLYVAVPVQYEDQTAALRTSMPLSEVEQLAADFRNTGLALLVVAIALTMVVAWLVFKRTSKPVDRLERVRTDFVANASHELKTPVAGIRLLSESIKTAYQDGDTEMIPVFADRLDKETSRLQNLVTDLLDLSRLEDEQYRTRSAETTDMCSAVSTCYEAHIRNARDKGLDFRLRDETPEGKECRVNMSAADAMLLVDNLVENAIIYTEKGSVTLRLRDGADTAVLIVSDTGIGIPAMDQERVFERFFRSDAARSREAGGTGLGLSLVKHVVERAKGSINLESTPGEGSTFTIYLPKTKR